MKIKWVWGLITLILIMTSVATNRPSYADDELESPEQILRKYTMTESLEFGIEPSYQITGRSEILDMTKLYLTMTHTINNNTSIKLNFGFLKHGYEVDGENIGFLRQYAFLASLIRGYGTSSLRPYWGFGIGLYYFQDFTAEQATYDGADPAYERREGSGFWDLWAGLTDDILDIMGFEEATIGQHIVGGIKYVKPDLTISLNIYREWVRAFEIFNEGTSGAGFEVDLDSWTIGVNFALRF